MTHVRTFWSVDTLNDNIQWMECLEEIKSWSKDNSSVPDFISDEQILLFLHSCYFDIEDTKKCMESYYKIRKQTPQFFENRDTDSAELKKALKVLFYGIFPERTSEGYRVVFHSLHDTKPSNYVFNDGFKLLMMMLDVVLAKDGPQDGIIMVFDMKGVKLGHLIRLPLYSVRKCLEFIQDGIPVRLKSVHVLNVHSLIDKIMMIVKPFLRKKFLDLLHFHKENDEEIYKAIPRRCLPKNYGGELESVQFYHEKYIEELESLRPLFLEESELFGKGVNAENEEFNSEIDVSSLNID